MTSNVPAILSITGPAPMRNRGENTAGLNGKKSPRRSEKGDSTIRARMKRVCSSIKQGMDCYTWPVIM